SPAARRGSLTQARRLVDATPVRANRTPLSYVSDTRPPSGASLQTGVEWHGGCNSRAGHPPRNRRATTHVRRLRPAAHRHRPRRHGPGRPLGQQPLTPGDPARDRFPCPMRLFRRSSRPGGHRAIPPPPPTPPPPHPRLGPPPPAPPTGVCPPPPQAPRRLTDGAPPALVARAAVVTKTRQRHRTTVTTLSH